MIDWLNTFLLIYGISSVFSIFCLIVDDDNLNIHEFILAFIPAAQYLYILKVINQSIPDKTSNPPPKNLLILVNEIIKNEDYKIDGNSLYNGKLGLYINKRYITIDHKEYDTPSKIASFVKKTIDNNQYSDKLEIYKRSKNNAV